jgi:hypothetical protein
MQTDDKTDRLITFNEAGRLLPEQSRPAISTWWRWWRRGIRGLRTVVVGGRRYTTENAVEEFIAATTAAANGEPLPIRSPARQERDILRAEVEVKKKLGRAHRPAKDGGGET